MLAWARVTPGTCCETHCSSPREPALLQPSSSAREPLRWCWIVQCQAPARSPANNHGFTPRLQRTGAPHLPARGTHPHQGPSVVLDCGANLVDDGLNELARQRARQQPVSAPEAHSNQGHTTVKHCSTSAQPRTPATYLRSDFKLSHVGAMLSAVICCAHLSSTFPTYESDDADTRRRSSSSPLMPGTQTRCHRYVRHTGQSGEART